MSHRVDCLGVLVCKIPASPPFLESGYFKQLTLEGRRMGIRLIIFSPMDVDWERRTVRAWEYHPASGRWIPGHHPIPRMVYDRCYYRDSQHYLAHKPHVSRFAKDPDIQLLGRPLGGKHQTHEILAKSPVIRPYLPDTRKLLSLNDIRQAIQQYGPILIKPNGGSHGRGVTSILPDRNGYRVRGRSRNNRTIDVRFPSEGALLNWLDQSIGTHRYIIQPYLELHTADGRPFDLRILVQKNATGDWVTTGMAVRTGKPHTLTSNLHGGGEAQRAIPFIHRHFSGDRIPRILHSIQLLADAVPKHIEKEHGRLLELGLDVGIDRQGRVWLLEVNSKPGRSVFLLTQEHEVRKRSIQLPIQYARTLFHGRVGGSA